jgi:hypothetical protein
MNCLLTAAQAAKKATVAPAPKSAVDWTHASGSSRHHASKSNPNRAQSAELVGHTGSTRASAMLVEPIPVIAARDLSVRRHRG